jgi:hypothetical protein
MPAHNHILLHLTLEPASGSRLRPADIGPELAAYVRALLDNLDASPIVIGASSDELTLVAPLPRNMSTAHLVFCIKRGTERWLTQRSATQRNFLWAPGYRALSVDRTSLTTLIRELQLRAAYCEPAPTTSQPTDPATSNGTDVAPPWAHDNGTYMT